MFFLLSLFSKPYEKIFSWIVLRQVLRNQENLTYSSTSQKCVQQQEQQAVLDPTASPQMKNRRRLRWLSPNDKTQSGQSKQRRRRRLRRLIFPLHGGDAATDRQCVLITQGGWIKRRKIILFPHFYDFTNRNANTMPNKVFFSTAPLPYCPPPPHVHICTVCTFLLPYQFWAMCCTCSLFLLLMRVDISTPQLTPKTAAQRYRAVGKASWKVYPNIFQIQNMLPACA